LVQKSAISKVIEVAQFLSKLLKNYNHAFFKLVKPLSYVPADVDLLVDSDQAGRVAHEIMRLGYTVTVKDPYCLTLTRGCSIIDLYVHPSLGGVIFIDGQRLLEHSYIMGFNGVEVRSIEGFNSLLINIDATFLPTHDPPS